jgi:hypothetical protein
MLMHTNAGRIPAYVSFELFEGVAMQRSVLDVALIRKGNTRWARRRDYLIESDCAWVAPGNAICGTSMSSLR